MKYLVKLNLKLEGNEKETLHLVEADTPKDGMEIALTSECHNEPCFDDYPDYDGCEDCGYIYEVIGIKELTDQQAAHWRDLTNFIGL